MLTTITLSAHAGPVTRFRDGEYITTPHSEVYREWREESIGITDATVGDLSDGTDVLKESPQA